MSFAFYNNKDLRHTELIELIVRMTGCKKYLELGVWYGKNLSRIKNYCDVCIGVDIEDLRKVKDTNLFVGTTDEFFKTNTETFDIIFIDADHSFESVSKDFKNSLKVLNPHGIIFIHDTDPINGELANSSFCGDSYLMIEWLEKNYSDILEVMTLPITEAGLTMVKRKGDKRTNSYL